MEIFRLQHLIFIGLVDLTDDKFTGEYFLRKNKLFGIIFDSFPFFSSFVTADIRFLLYFMNFGVIFFSADLFGKFPNTMYISFFWISKPRVNMIINIFKVMNNSLFISLSISMLNIIILLLLFKYSNFYV